MPGHTVVAGAGYTGGRVLAALGPGRATGFRRSAVTGAGTVRLDLDREGAAPPPLPTDYALLYTIPPAREAEADSRLARLLALLEPLPARIVYLSTSGVYGDCGGEVVDEEREPRPASSRAKRRLAAEMQLHEWASARDVALVVLRAPGIYGPGRLGLDGIRERRAMIREADAHPGNRIHVDDLVSACLAALSPDRPAGICNLADGDHRSSTWFTMTVARLAGLPPPPEVSRDEARRTFPQSRLSFLEESRRLDTRKMREVLKVVPRYADAEDGIRASLEADGLLAL